MKKILLLGGSAQQVVAIEKAKELGFYTILCDYLPDNPGQFVADKFYLVSTTDKGAVLEVAKAENIDGVLAYASDPAAPTAAYVAEELGLPGNPYESVEILCNKDKFRAFLSKNGFHTPKAKGYETVGDALADAESGYFKFPVIIKPTDSSGSKGVTVLDSIHDDMKNAVQFALSYSRSKKIVVEEFIVKKHSYLIGGDIFVSDGKIALWGLMNCHRDSNVNPLVPVGKSFPPQLDDSDLSHVKQELQKLVDKLGMKNGSMNVELIVDSQNDVYLIDVGPRGGGNMIPDLMGYIFGVDVVELNIKAAMNVNVDIDNVSENNYFATYNLHSDRNGSLKNITYDDKIRPFIIKKCIYKNTGDQIEYFDNASKAIGIIFFKFDTKGTMDSIYKEINALIHINLKENEI